MFIVSILIEGGRKWNDFKIPKRCHVTSNTDLKNYAKENSDILKYFVEVQKYKIFSLGNKTIIIQLFPLVCPCSVSERSYRAFLG